MRERPILFSGPLVRALLDGRKSQTRRILKPQPFSNGIVYSRELGDIVCHDDYLPPSAMLLRAGSKKHPYNSTQDEWPRLCPFGAPGDRLWVREAHALVWGSVAYKAGTDELSMRYKGECVPKWRPSIHMPRWASRITLEITSVRVERLNDISEDDAWAEGVEPAPAHGKWVERPRQDGGHWSARKAFADLWDSIHGADAWDANPFCWVIEFKRVLP